MARDLPERPRTSFSSLPAAVVSTWPSSRTPASSAIVIGVLACTCLLIKLLFPFFFGFCVPFFLIYNNSVWPEFANTVMQPGTYLFFKCTRASAQGPTTLGLSSLFHRVSASRHTGFAGHNPRNPWTCPAPDWERVHARW